MHASTRTLTRARPVQMMIQQELQQWQGTHLPSSDSAMMHRAAHGYSSDMSSARVLQNLLPSVSMPHGWFATTGGKGVGTLDSSSVGSLSAGTLPCMSPRSITHPNNLGT